MKPISTHRKPMNPYMKQIKSPVLNKCTPIKTLYNTRENNEMCADTLTVQALANSTAGKSAA